MGLDVRDSKDLPASKTEEFYDTVLAPSFVDSELIPRAEFLADLNDPRGETVAPWRSETPERSSVAL